MLSLDFPYNLFYAPKMLLYWSLMRERIHVANATPFRFQYNFLKLDTTQGVKVSEGLILVQEVHVWDRWTIVSCVIYSKSLSKWTLCTRGGYDIKGKGNKIRTLVTTNAILYNTSSSILTTRHKYLSCH